MKACLRKLLESVLFGKASYGHAYPGRVRGMIRMGWNDEKGEVSLTGCTRKGEQEREGGGGHKNGADEFYGSRSGGNGP